MEDDAPEGKQEDRGLEIESGHSISSYYLKNGTFGPDYRDQNCQVTESGACFLAYREPLWGFPSIALWWVRPGGCSTSASPGLLSRAGTTVSAALSPTAVSSFTLFQVPGPQPATPTQLPRRLPSWGSRAESFGNLALMSSVIKVLIRQVGLPRWVPSHGGERSGEFRWPFTSALGPAHFHCRRRRQRWRWCR